MKICGIYKITSPSKKVYIGQSVDIAKRWQTYRVSLGKGQISLYRSFLKYGINKHIFEILCQCDKSELNNLEKYYVDLFQTFHNKYGLNIRDGGGANAKMAEETKIKISEKLKGRPAWNKGLKSAYPAWNKGHPAWNKGKTMPEEIQERLRTMNIGRKCSDITKQKMSISHKGNKNTLGKHWKQKTKKTAICN